MTGGIISANSVKVRISRNAAVIRVNVVAISGIAIILTIILAVDRRSIAYPHEN